MKCLRCLKPYRTPADDEALTKEERAELRELESGFCPKCTEQRAARVPPLDVDAVFGKAGLLAKANPKYEPRPGQVRLAKAIARAAEGRTPFLGEGPCGIGKSKAYGATAAHLARNGKKVLIVTASIALQEQLIGTDLPALRSELGWDFSFGLMKGKNNYLCVSESGSLGDGIPDDIPRDMIPAYRIVRDWSRTTTTGDKSELETTPPAPVWGKFAVGTGECPGKKCAEYTMCFSKVARENAAKSDVLVTNYHMLFMNMAYSGKLLPVVDVVILDEAHEAADIARDVLGFSLARGSFNRIAKEASKRGSEDLARQIREGAKDVFDTLLRFHDSGHYAALLRGPAPIDPTPLVRALETFAEEYPNSNQAMAATDRADDIRSALEVSDPNMVYSIEVTAHQVQGRTIRTAALRSRFVQPGGYLSSALWGAYESVIAVSATFTAEGKFDFAARELGAPAGISTLVVETPFQFDRQALLVIPEPKYLPEPNDEQFTRIAAARLLETIWACGGRTMGLFTSYRALNAVYEIVLREVLKWPAEKRPRILRQGGQDSASTQILIRDFKLDCRSVLLGVTSFWTGIDVPGEALTGLVIDRLPFGRPDDPVTLRLAETDKNVFANYMVPKSILMLRQGVGRLIRSVYDIGTVVILDKRVTTTPYGSRFLRSLPRMRRGTSTKEIRPFLAANGVSP